VHRGIKEVIPMDRFMNYLYFLTTGILLVFIARYICEALKVKWSNEKSDKGDKVKKEEKYQDW
jgi:hypothetical protein